ncbi:MAG: PVC-type heme-binding CxxCH protein [Planctomycetota bacterium]
MPASHPRAMSSVIGALAATLALVAGPAGSAVAAPAAPIRVLFLGDQGHHAPTARHAQLEPVLAARGIELVYTENLDDLAPATLAAYDVLAVYANIDELPPAREAALLDFVRDGKGLVPLHCASYCFRNSPAWVDLVGAQFQKHGATEFRTESVAPDHPIMKGFQGFSSFDETYVHTRHNPRGRTVLEERVEGDHREPWTWVRTEGKGRVFYTAWGHDERTWSHPGFHNLVERGIRFAAGTNPAAAGPYVDHPVVTRAAAGLAPFTYESAKVPFYDPDASQWGKQLEPKTTMQQALDPEESSRHAITPEGFAVGLYAAEPLLAAKPLALAFDTTGRLLVIESVDYPNDIVLPGEGVGRDRIVMLADTDGDGRADARTVYAEGLSIPTSLLHHGRGFIVAQAPSMLYLEDGDGDGRAEIRRELFSGWGTRDTHSGPSNLTWGFDGWVYGMVGYSGFEGEVGGEKLRFGQGFFRFLPDGSKLEFLRSTNNNSWGFGFSEEGLVFGSTANGNPSEHMPLPARVYERVRGWSATTLGGIAGTPKMELAPRGDGVAPIRQVDHHGRFTAAAGHRLYTARAFPPEYWNRAAFVCEPTGHVVATFQLQPVGAGFRSRMAWNLVASDDEWSAPIQAEVGPDGAVWVIDWYNYIVQHNPTPAGFENGKGNAYQTPLRDKTHGRIWRVGPARLVGQPPAASPVRPDVAALVAGLRDDNMFWRERAQRALVTRSDAATAVPALVGLVQARTIDAIGLDPAAIHALWTMSSLGVLAGPGTDLGALDAARGALRHPSAGVRATALRVLPRDEATLVAVDRSEVGADRTPLVRLALLEMLSECPSSPLAGELVRRLLAQPGTLADPILADAATAAAAVHAADVLPWLLGTVPKATHLPAAVAVAALAAVVADEPAVAPSPRKLALVERVSEHVARGGDGALVNRIVIGLEQAPADEAGACLAGLARGWPRGTGLAFDAAASAAIARLVERLPPAAQGQLVTFVQRTGSDVLDAHVESISRALVAVIDGSGSDADRGDAAERLVALRPADPEVVGQLLTRTGGRTSPQLAALLVTAAARSQAPEAIPALLDRLGGFTPAVREAAVRGVLAARDGAQRIVERMEGGKLAAGDIPLVERSTLSENPDRRFRDRARKALAKAGGLADADRQKVIDEVLPVVLAGGDVARGKGVFAQQCAKCHRHSGEGGQVGPDLTGMAVHPPQELLVHLLDPNRSVEGNFRAYTVATDDGRVVTGLLAAESRTAIEIVDAEGKRHPIQRDEIEAFQPSPNSLMPVGFEKQIPAAGIADLLAFLTARGKFVPLPLGPVATAVSTRGLFYASENPVERLVFPDWAPKTYGGVPFHLVDPQGDTLPNVVMLNGPQGYLPPKMPRSVTVPVGGPARAIHLLGGIAGWGFPAIGTGSTSMIVRIVYDDGATEDHPLVNGEHVADYIRRVDVPQSTFAADLSGRQVRTVRVEPKRAEPVARLELLKGPDGTAPIVIAITVESP